MIEQIVPGTYKEGTDLVLYKKSEMYSFMGAGGSGTAFYKKICLGVQPRGWNKIKYKIFGDIDVDAINSTEFQKLLSRVKFLYFLHKVFFAFWLIAQIYILMVGIKVFTG